MVPRHLAARAALIVALVATGCGSIRAARFLEDALGPADALAERVDERWEERDGLRARFVRPRGVAGDLPTVLLCHGAVEDGAEDPRLVALARALAVRGARVVTPDLVSLRRYRLDPAAPGRIARLALDLAEDGRIALAGISIGGSYALVAAARPELAGRLTCVFAFGAYEDLERLLRGWLVAPRETPELYDPLVEGRRRVLAGNLDRLAPRADELSLRYAIDLLLAGRPLPPHAERGLTQRGRLVLTAARSTEPLAPDVADALLAPLRSELQALSPKAAPPAPVYLLHGEHDPVVPVYEAKRLASVGHPARLHRTDLFDHVDPERRPSFFRAWPLLRFVDDVLDAMGVARG